LDQFSHQFPDAMCCQTLAPQIVCDYIVTTSSKCSARCELVQLLIVQIRYSTYCCLVIFTTWYYFATPSESLVVNST